MTAPHCPVCEDDVSEPYDYGCWRCLACGAVFDGKTYQERHQYPVDDQFPDYW
jgi:ribosomal protein L37AE/L43A